MSSSNINSMFVNVNSTREGEIQSGQTDQSDVDNLFHNQAVAISSHSHPYLGLHDTSQHDQSVSLLKYYDNVTLGINMTHSDSSHSLLVQKVESILKTDSEVSERISDDGRADVTQVTDHVLNHADSNRSPDGNHGLKRTDRILVSDWARYDESTENSNHNETNAIEVIQVEALNEGEPIHLRDCAMNTNQDLFDADDVTLQIEASPRNNDAKMPIKQSSQDSITGLNGHPFDRMPSETASPVNLQEEQIPKKEKETCSCVIQ